MKIGKAESALEMKIAAIRIGQMHEAIDVGNLDKARYYKALADCAIERIR